MPGQPMPGQGGPGAAALSEAPLSKLRQARARMAEVRQALSSASTPEEIRGCAPLLEEAIACLQAIPSLAAVSLEDRPAAAREWEALRFEAGVVRRLIEGGAEFYQGWARILAAVLAGYTPSGQPAALTAPGSVSLQG